MVGVKEKSSTVLTGIDDGGTRKSVGLKNLKVYAENEEEKVHSRRAVNPQRKVSLRAPACNPLSPSKDSSSRSRSSLSRLNHGVVVIQHLASVHNHFFWGYLFTHVAGGIWADKVGGKLVLGFGVMWWSVATILTPVAAMLGLPYLM